MLLGFEKSQQGLTTQAATGSGRPSGLLSSTLLKPVQTSHTEAAHQAELLKILLIFISIISTLRAAILKRSSKSRWQRQNLEPPRVRDRQRYAMWRCLPTTANPRMPDS